MEKFYKLTFGEFSHPFESMKDVEDFKTLLAKTDPKIRTTVSFWNDEDEEKYRNKNIT